MAGWSPDMALLTFDIRLLNGRKVSGEESMSNSVLDWMAVGLVGLAARGEI